MLCHAAGVVVAGNGMAIAGMSGGGKSTLALHLLGTGAAFCSNDRLLVRSAGSGARMTGVAKQPRINPGTALNNPRLESVLSSERRSELARIEESELWDLEEKYDVDVRVRGLRRLRDRGREQADRSGHPELDARVVSADRAVRSRLAGPSGLAPGGDEVTWTVPPAHGGSPS